MRPVLLLVLLGTISFIFPSCKKAKEHKWKLSVCDKRTFAAEFNELSEEMNEIIKEKRGLYLFELSDSSQCMCRILYDKNRFNYDSLTNLLIDKGWYIPVNNRFPEGDSLDAHLKRVDSIKAESLNVQRSRGEYVPE